MTKPLAVAVLVAFLCMAVPATAHGAPEAREFDARVLTDDDGAVGYGQGADQGVPYEGGHDLLALDVREARDPLTGAPSLVFRLIVQHGDPEQGELRDEITFMAGGREHVLGFRTTDGAMFEGIGFDRVEGPFPVGDGFPQAIDGWIATGGLGIGPGDAVTDIEVQGHVGEARADVMPGTYTVGGVDLPEAEAPVLGTYSLAGPQGVVDIAVRANDTIKPDAPLTLTLTSLLDGVEQTVRLDVSAPSGVNASLASSTLALAPGESRDVEVGLSAAPGAAGGTLSIRAVSEVGGLAIDLEQAVIAVEGAAEAGDGAEVVSGDLAPGASYAYRFLAAGTFEYHCHPHPWMTGTIEILPAANGTTPQTHVIEAVEPSQDDPQGWQFTPDVLTIRAGDTVVWVNQGQAVHDVRGFNDAVGDGHDHDHDHGTTSEEDTPMPFLLPALIGALLLRRRR